MKSVLISYNFTSLQINDEHIPKKDTDVSRFLKRLAQDQAASPASEIRAFRLFENGSSEEIK